MDIFIFTAIFGAFLFDKSHIHDFTVLFNSNTDKHILHAICTQANLLAKKDSIKAMCSIGEVYKKNPTVIQITSRLQHSMQSGLLDTKLAAATPLLSNKARVAVVHSHGRWFCWGLSQHGRSCVRRLSSAEEIENRPDVVAGEETAFWALNNVPESSNENNRAALPNEKIKIICAYIK